MRLSIFKFLPMVVLALSGFTNISWVANLASHNTAEVSGAHLARRIGVLFTGSNHHPNAYIHTMLYDSLRLQEEGLSVQAFDYAMTGYDKLKESGEVSNSTVLTIIDFDQPSYKKRMYVIDVENSKILFHTWAAHGKNTGREVAQSFSNTPESNKSSLGFYITNDTYYGSKGYSLRLTGLEQNLNNNAYGRAIVLHGAAYVSQAYIDAQGFIGRSHGCPAVPKELNKPIIDVIKNGSVLFIYNSSYRPTGKFQLL